MKSTQELFPSLPPSRARLAAVLRAARGVISVELTSQTLDVDKRSAAKLLSRWRAQGWLRRVGHGVYVPVPLDLASSEQVVEDPWILVPSLFGASYIGGWTAAHYWDLTEQLFNDTLVFTTRTVTQKHVAQGITFIARHVSEERLFGLTTIWRSSTRINVSNAERTIVDMLAMPDTGGGINQVVECIEHYLKDNRCDRGLLIRYAEQFKNGAIFKRLGYLSETRFHDREIAAACRARLTQGYAKLDPSLACRRLATTWRLWVPENDR